MRTEGCIAAAPVGSGMGQDITPQGDGCLGVTMREIDQGQFAIVVRSILTPVESFQAEKLTVRCAAKEPRQA